MSTFKQPGILVSFSVVLVLSFAAGATAIDVDSLLIKSIGGEKALAAVRNMDYAYASGRVDFNGQPGSFASYFKAPDRFYIEIKLGMLDMARGHDGRTVWMRDHNGRITVLEGFERRNLFMELYFASYSYLLPDRQPGRVEYVGEREDDDGRFHVLRFLPLNRDTVLGYFDVESGLWRKRESRIDNAATSEYYAAYDTIGGILMPTVTRTDLADAGVTMTLTLDSSTINVPFDTSVFAMPGDRPADFTFPKGRTSVPLPVRYVDGHIYVRAAINGGAPAWFILDSGSSANLFHEPNVADLDLEVVGSLPTKGIGGFEEVSLVRPDSIVIGDLVLHNQVAGVLDLSGLAGSVQPMGGILGYDFLSRFPMLIDYQQPSVTVYNPETFVPSDSGSTVPFHLSMGIPTIRAEILGIGGDFIVDLGNPYGVILHTPFVERENLEERLDDIRGFGTGTGGIGGSVTGRSAYAASMAFGEVRLSSLRVILAGESSGMTGSAEIAGNIGNRVLEGFKVLFDYGHQRLVFFPTEAE